LQYRTAVTTVIADDIAGPVHTCSVLSPIQLYMCRLAACALSCHQFAAHLVVASYHQGVTSLQQQMCRAHCVLSAVQSLALSMVEQLLGIWVDIFEV
jgi:hypothetical protein